MSVMKEPARELAASIQASAVLDEAHLGHIHGAFGTIVHGDHRPRIGGHARIRTLLAILGPGGLNRQLPAVRAVCRFPCVRQPAPASSHPAGAPVGRAARQGFFGAEGTTVAP